MATEGARKTFGSMKHGTRARYVAGCRCAACTRANNEASRKRSQRLRDAAAEVTPTGNPIESTMVRAGKAYNVLRCPGANGRPCVSNPPTWLKNVGTRVCRACVDHAAVWNGLVDAAPIIRHLQLLRGKGVGYRAAAEAADVSPTVLSAVLAGKKKRVRAQSVRKVLAVDEGAVADHALVSARATWKLLEELLEQGYTRAELARGLGIANGRLQVGRRHVTARMQWQVMRLHHRLHRDTVSSTRVFHQLARLRTEMYEDDRLRAELGEHADEVLAVRRDGKISRAAADAMEAAYRRMML